MKNKKGFTLIEVVISMVVIAIIMYAVIAVFITAGVRGVNVEVFTVAQSLAEGKLEQVMALPYASIANENEIAYDDDLSAYTHQVTMTFVDPNNFDLDILNDLGCKKIVVEIRHPQLETPITLQSVRANY